MRRLLRLLPLLSAVVGRSRPEECDSLLAFLPACLLVLSMGRRRRLCSFGVAASGRLLGSFSSSFTTTTTLSVRNKHHHPMIFPYPAATHYVKREREREQLLRFWRQHSCLYSASSKCEQRSSRNNPKERELPNRSGVPSRMFTRENGLCRTHISIPSNINSA